METLSDIEVLKTRIAQCNEILASQGDDAMRLFFQTFKGDFSARAPADPFSDAGNALWEVRNISWLGFGFDEACFQSALNHTGRTWKPRVR